jgi:hypothetical protein
VGVLFAETRVFELPRIPKMVRHMVNEVKERGVLHRSSQISA